LSQEITMKKHMIVVAGLLLTLGTAVAATMSTEAQTVKPAAAATSETASKQSAQIVGLWKAHASSAASVPMARPL
jgi:hypothetical protein